MRGTKTATSDAMTPIVERCGMASYLREAEPHLPIKWKHMSKRLPDRCAEAGIEPLPPNGLRRTVATRLIESGVDAYTVAKITRHATLGMLKHVYDRSNTAATHELIHGPPRSSARGRTTKNGTRDKEKAPGGRGFETQIQLDSVVPKVGLEPTHYF